MMKSFMKKRTAKKKLDTNHDYRLATEYISKRLAAVERLTLLRAFCRWRELTVTGMEGTNRSASVSARSLMDDLSSMIAGMNESVPSVGGDEEEEDEEESDDGESETESESSYASSRASGMLSLRSSMTMAGAVSQPPSAPSSLKLPMRVGGERARRPSTTQTLHMMQKDRKSLKQRLFKKKGQKGGEGADGATLPSKPMRLVPDIYDDDTSDERDDENDDDDEGGGRLLDKLVVEEASDAESTDDDDDDDDDDVPVQRTPREQWKFAISNVILLNQMKRADEAKKRGDTKGKGKGKGRKSGREQHRRSSSSVSTVSSKVGVSAISSGTTSTTTTTTGVDGDDDDSVTLEFGGGETDITTTTTTTSSSSSSSSSSRTKSAASTAGAAGNGDIGKGKGKGKGTSESKGKAKRGGDDDNDDGGDDVSSSSSSSSSGGGGSANISSEIKMSVDEMKEMAMKQAEEQHALSQPQPLPTRLIDYYCRFGVRPERLNPLIHQLKKSRKPPTIASVRRFIEDFKLSFRDIILQDRYPRHDYDKFRLNKNWSQFAFPDGVHVLSPSSGATSSQLRPRVSYAVMTLENGSQIFSTYFIYYRQFRVTNPHYNRRSRSFSGPCSSSTSTSTSTSPAPSPARSSKNVSSPRGCMSPTAATSTGGGVDDADNADDDADDAAALLRLLCPMCYKAFAIDTKECDVCGSCELVERDMPSTSGSKASTKRSRKAAAKEKKKQRSRAAEKPPVPERRHQQQQHTRTDSSSSISSSSSSSSSSSGSSGGGTPPKGASNGGNDDGDDESGGVKDGDKKSWFRWGSKTEKSPSTTTSSTTASSITSSGTSHHDDARYAKNLSRFDQSLAATAAAHQRAELAAESADSDNNGNGNSNNNNNSSNNSNNNSSSSISKRGRRGGGKRSPSPVHMTEKSSSSSSLLSLPSSSMMSPRRKSIHQSVNLDIDEVIPLQNGQSQTFDSPASPAVSSSSSTSAGGTASSTSGANGAGTPNHSAHGGSAMKGGGGGGGGRGSHNGSTHGGSTHNNNNNTPAGRGRHRSEASNSSGSSSSSSNSSSPKGSLQTGVPIASQRRVVDTGGVPERLQTMFRHIREASLSIQPGQAHEQMQLAQQQQQLANAAFDVGGSVSAVFDVQQPRYWTLWVPECLCLISHYAQFETYRDTLCQLYHLACDIARNEVDVDGVSSDDDSDSDSDSDSDDTDGAGDSSSSSSSSSSSNALAVRHRRNRNRNRDKCRMSHLLERYIVQIVDELPLPIPGDTDVCFTVYRKLLRLRLSPSRQPFSSTFHLHRVFERLGPQNVLRVLSAILCEERILFLSSAISMLTVTTQSFLQMLFPFQWWYAYIPCLTGDMLDAHQIPQPYILGINPIYVDRLTELDNAVIVNLDEGTVLFHNVTYTPLPHPSGQAVLRRLKRCVHNRLAREDCVPASSLAAPGHNDDMENEFDFGVYEALLRFYSELLSGYRKFLFFVQNAPFFNRSGFLQYRCGVNNENNPEAERNRRFMTKLITSRAFDVYMEEEQEPDLYHDFLATGVPLSDLHELVTCEIPKSPLDIYEVPAPTHVFTTAWRRHALKATTPTTTTPASEKKKTVGPAQSIHRGDDAPFGALQPMSNPFQQPLRECFLSLPREFDIDCIDDDDDDDDSDINIDYSDDDDNANDRSPSKTASRAAVAAAATAAVMQQGGSAAVADTVSAMPRLSPTKEELMAEQKQEDERNNSSGNCGDNARVEANDTVGELTSSTSAASPASSASSRRKSSSAKSLSRRNSRRQSSSRKSSLFGPNAGVSVGRLSTAVRSRVNSNFSVSRGSLKLGKDLTTMSLASSLSTMAISNEDAASRQRGFSTSAMPSSSRFSTSSASPSSSASSPRSRSPPQRSSIVSKGNTSRTRAMSSYAHHHLPPELLTQQQLNAFKIGESLARVFSSQELDPAELEDLRGILQVQSARDEISSILRQRNSNGHSRNVTSAAAAASASLYSSEPGGGMASVCLTTQSYASLAKILHAVLDACQSHNDCNNATGVLEAGDVFYKEDIEGNRVYVETEIHDHTFWRNIRYWKGACACALREKEDEGAFEDRNQRDDFFLQWMIATSHAMLNKEVPCHYVTTCMEQLIGKHKLSDKHRVTWSQFVTKLAGLSQAMVAMEQENTKVSK